MPRSTQNNDSILSVLMNKMFNKSTLFWFIIFNSFITFGVHAAAFTTPSVSKTSTKGITVSWPQYIDSSTKYNLDIEKDGTNYPQNNLTVKSKVWTTLSPGVRRYRVQACHSSGCTSYSNWTNLVVLEGNNQDPIPAVVLSGSNIKVVWDKFGDSATTYHLEVLKDGVLYPKTYTNQTWVQWYGLSEGFRKYRIQKCHSGVCTRQSNWSDYVYIAPGTYTTPSVSKSNSNISVSWPGVNLPSGYSASVNYVVKVVVSDENGQNPKEVVKPAQTATSVSYWNLAPGTRRYYVKSCVNNVCSGYSAASSAVVINTSPISAEVNANKTITAGWVHVTNATYEFKLLKNGLTYIANQQQSSPYYTSPVLTGGNYVVSYRPCTSTYGCASWSEKSLTITKDKLAAPVISPSASAIKLTDKVQITSANANAQIKYAIIAHGASCNSVPTWSNYSAGFSLTTASTVCAKTEHADYISSGITSRGYTLASAETPTILAISDTLKTTDLISLNTKTSGASIRYGTTTYGGSCGSVNNWQTYSAAFNITSATKVCAKTEHAAYITSAVAEKNYQVYQVAAPTISPNGGTIAITDKVYLASATAGVTFKYMEITAGSSCSAVTSWHSRTTSGFYLSQMGKLCVKAEKTGYIGSTIKEAVFTASAHGTPTVTKISDTGVGVTWPALVKPADKTGVVSYHHKTAVTNINGLQTQTYDQPVLSVNKRDYYGLAPGSRQYFVKACIDNLCTDYSAASAAIVTDTAPLSVTVQNQTATLSWESITSGGFDTQLHKNGALVKSGFSNTNTYDFTDLAGGSYVAKYRTCTGGYGCGNWVGKPFSLVVPPVADAGADIDTMEWQGYVKLAGSGTDADGSIVSYKWQQISGPDVAYWTDINAATTTFRTPMIEADAILVFKLTVTDNDGNTATDTVSVAVNDRANLNISFPTASYKYATHEPLFAKGLDVRDSNDVVEKVETNIYNNDTGKYVFSWVEANYNSATKEASFTYSDVQKAQLQPGVKYRFYLFPQDDGIAGGDGWPQYQFFYINDKPQLASNKNHEMLIGNSKTLTLADFTVTDSDDSNHTLTVLAGANYTVSGNSITPAANFAGTLSVSVKVNDGTEDSNTVIVYVEVKFPSITAPTLNKLADNSVQVNWVKPANSTGLSYIVNVNVVNTKYPTGQNFEKTSEATTENRAEYYSVTPGVRKYQIKPCFANLQYCGESSPWSANFEYVPSINIALEQDATQVKFSWLHVTYATYELVFKSLETGIITTYSDLTTNSKIISDLTPGNYQARYRTYTTGYGWDTFSAWTDFTVAAKQIATPVINTAAGALGLTDEVAVSSTTTGISVNYAVIDTTASCSAVTSWNTKAAASGSTTVPLSDFGRLCVKATKTDYADSVIVSADFTAKKFLSMNEVKAPSIEEIQPNGVAVEWAAFNGADVDYKANVFIKSTKHPEGKNYPKVKQLGTNLLSVSLHPAVRQYQVKACLKGTDKCTEYSELSTPFSLSTPDLTVDTTTNPTQARVSWPQVFSDQESYDLKLVKPDGSTVIENLKNTGAKLYTELAIGDYQVSYTPKSTEYGDAASSKVVNFSIQGPKLTTPVISPNGGELSLTDKVMVTAGADTTVQYAVLDIATNPELTCDDNSLSWTHADSQTNTATTTSAELLLLSMGKLCVKTIKPDHTDSDIINADFTAKAFQKTPKIETLGDNGLKVSWDDYRLSEGLNETSQPDPYNYRLRVKVVVESDDPESPAFEEEYLKDTQTTTFADFHTLHPAKRFYKVKSCLIAHPTRCTDYSEFAEYNMATPNLTVDTITEPTLAKISWPVVHASDQKYTVEWKVTEADDSTITTISDLTTARYDIPELTVGTSYVVRYTPNHPTYGAAKPSIWNQFSLGQNEEPDVEIDDSASQIRPTRVANPLDGQDSGTVVGALPGKLEIGATGAAEYSVPIITAPGSGGLTPSLSLTYSSNQENGWLGKGWSIGGISVISRCAKNTEQEGETGSVNLDENDRYCLDGSKLFLVNDVTYGSNRSDYYVEGRRPIEIEVTTSSGSEPSEFEVRFKDGSIITYGDVNNPISIEGSTTAQKIFSWPMVKKTDASGNTIDYIYEQAADSVSYRLSSVKYRNDKMNEISFIYQDRNDLVSGYVAGQAYRVEQRLAKVISKVDNNELRTYTLNYDYANITQRSILKSITACRADSCLPATNFSWDQGRSDFYPERTLSSGTDDSDDFHNTRVGHPISYLYLDMNGDGILDYLKVRDHKDEDDDDIILVKGGDHFTVHRKIRDIATQEFRHSAEVMDYNHDGRDDVIFKKNNAWFLYLSEIDANDPTAINYDFDNPFDLSVPVESQDIRITDYNGDGYPDFSYVYNNQLKIRLSNARKLTQPGGSLFSSGFGSDTGPYLHTQAFLPAITLNIPEIEASSDWNQDYFYGNIDKYFKTADLDSDGIGEFIIGVPINTGSHRCFSYLNWYIYQWNNSELIKIGQLDATEQTEPVTNNGSSCDSPIPDASPIDTMLNLEIADFNNDGLNDIYYFRLDAASVLPDWDTYITPLYAYARLNTGQGFSEEIPITEYSKYIYGTERFIALDYNGDGYQDILSGQRGETEKWQVSYFDGTSFAAAVETEMDFGEGGSFTDINGDTLVDYINFNGRMHYRLAVGDKPDFITGITPGSEITQTITYQSITAENAGDYYIGDHDAAFKIWGNGSLVVDANTPTYVVTSVRDGKNRLSYQYRGLKVQFGRGSLGFAEVANFDEVNNIRRIAYYHQSPSDNGLYRTGLLAKTETYYVTPNGATAPCTTNCEPPPDCGGEENQCPLKRYGISLNKVAVNSNTTNDTSNDDILLAQTIHEYNAQNTESCVYPAKSVKKSYDFKTGSLLSRVETENEQPDAWCNIGKSTVKVYEGATGTSAFSTVITENRYELHNLHKGGRLTRQQKSYSVASNADDITQVTTYGYGGNGLLLWQELDPIGDSGSSVNDVAGHDYNVKTTYLRADGFGNVTDIIVTGANIKASAKHFEFDELGRYIVEETDYINFPLLNDKLVMSIKHDPVLGTPIETTAVNGQKAYLGYSQLGRLNFNQSIDGSYSTMEQILCASDCPITGFYKEVDTLSHSGDEVVYFDKYGTKIAEKVQILKEYNSGAGTTDWVWQRYRFDDKGRLTAQSIPHFASQGITQLEEGDEIANLPHGYAGIAYDELARPVHHIKADKSNWYTRYDGLTLTKTDPDGLTRVETSNVLGQQVQTQDQDQNITSFFYDSLGNLRLTRRTHSDISGGTGNIDTIIKSDHMGRKVQLIDPDIGAINYKNDALGRLLWQQDNKGQVINQTYDVLGRILTRTATLATGETDESITWQYDQAEHGLGAVNKIIDTKNSISETFEYHWLSKPSKKITTFGIDAQGEPAANATSYLEQTVYHGPDKVYLPQLNLDAANQIIDYGYYDNYLISKHNRRNKELLWQFKKADPWLNIKEFGFGDNKTTTRGFDELDGNLTSIFTAGVQNLEYHFDSKANLEYRHDNLAQLYETFHYDNLNRIKTVDLRWSAIISTTANYETTYDHLGNIRFKTGVGHYQYLSGRPHAVSQITGGSLAGSYNYDANGNMTSGGGRDLVEYNTIDKPTLIQTEHSETSFSYGLAEGRRFKRIDVKDGVTTETRYLGAVEFIKVNGVDNEVRRYLEGHAIEHQFLTGEQEIELLYLHKDHLGSIDTITTTAGAVKQKFSYDIWGQRRSTGNYGQDLTINGALSLGSFVLTSGREAQLTRGFTGHEHIDDAGLIHMNGRIYDPRLARFMSADPIVSDPSNLQAYNRYSYVMNNPLNATDPSGYEGVAGFIATAVAIIGANNYYVAIAMKIYAIYNAVDGMYNAIQAFKYDGGFAAALNFAMSAYGAYGAITGDLPAKSTGKDSGTIEPKADSVNAGETGGEKNRVTRDKIAVNNGDKNDFVKADKEALDAKLAELNAKRDGLIFKGDGELTAKQQAAEWLNKNAGPLHDEFKAEVYADLIEVHGPGGGVGIGKIVTSYHSNLILLEDVKRSIITTYGPMQNYGGVVGHWHVHPNSAFNPSYGGPYDRDSGKMLPGTSHYVSSMDANGNMDMTSYNAAKAWYAKDGFSRNSFDNAITCVVGDCH